MTPPHSSSSTPGNNPRSSPSPSADPAAPPNYTLPKCDQDLQALSVKQLKHYLLSILRVRPPRSCLDKEDIVAAIIAQKPDWDRIAAAIRKEEGPTVMPGPVPMNPVTPSSAQHPPPGVSTGLGKWAPRPDSRTDAGGKRQVPGTSVTVEVKKTQASSASGVGASREERIQANLKLQRELKSRLLFLQQKKDKKAAKEKKDEKEKKEEKGEESDDTDERFVDRDERFCLRDVSLAAASFFARCSPWSWRSWSVQMTSNIAVGWDDARFQVSQ